MIKPCPIYPFQKGSIDLFKTHGEDCLVIADLYSEFFDFEKLKTTTSFDVIKNLKNGFHCLEYLKSLNRITGHSLLQNSLMISNKRVTSIIKRQIHILQGPTDFQKGMFK